MFFNRCNEMEHTGMNMNGCCNTGCTCPPVMECPQERVVNREMNYEVPQVSPFM